MGPTIGWIVALAPRQIKHLLARRACGSGENLLQGEKFPRPGGLIPPEAGGSPPSPRRMALDQVASLRGVGRSRRTAWARRELSPVIKRATPEAGWPLRPSAFNDRRCRPSRCRSGRSIARAGAEVVGSSQRLRARELLGLLQFLLRHFECLLNRHSRDSLCFRL